MWNILILILPYLEGDSAMRPLLDAGGLGDGALEGAGGGGRGGHGGPVAGGGPVLHMAGLLHGGHVLEASHVALHQVPANLVGLHTSSVI